MAALDQKSRSSVEWAVEVKDTWKGFGQGEERGEEGNLVRWWMSPTGREVARGL